MDSHWSMLGHKIMIMLMMFKEEQRSISLELMLYIIRLKNQNNNFLFQQYKDKLSKLIQVLLTVEIQKQKSFQGIGDVGYLMVICN